jgi:hypothetical protein
MIELKKQNLCYLNQYHIIKTVNENRPMVICLVYKAEGLNNNFKGKISMLHRLIHKPITHSSIGTH